MQGAPPGGGGAPWVRGAGACDRGLVARGDGFDLDLAARELITVFELATYRRP
ncbi:hypothetical protein [Streptosporangium sp. NPDC001681]|uniref:hypothetical protein n=1 Tax=Streptosporangium sp. NPDC001681 TaxID=3154395 RepID=UPI00332E6662